MKDLAKELREFLMRGNVIDLAVAVIIGIAFGAVITSFVDDILMQVIAAIIGQPDFSTLTFTIGDGVIRYGAFLNAVIYFVIVGTAMFFVVKAVSALYRKREDESEPSEVDLLTEIRDLLRERQT